MHHMSQGNVAGMQVSAGASWQLAHGCRVVLQEIGCLLNHKMCALRCTLCYSHGCLAYFRAQGGVRGMRDGWWRLKRKKRESWEDASGGRIEMKIQFRPYST